MNRKLKKLIERLDDDRKKYGDDELIRLFYGRYGIELVEQENVLEALDLILTGICDLINFMAEYDGEYE
jgi:hypothetical protein